MQFHCSIYAEGRGVQGIYFSRYLHLSQAQGQCWMNPRNILSQFRKFSRTESTIFKACPYMGMCTWNVNQSRQSNMDFTNEFLLSFQVFLQSLMALSPIISSLWLYRKTVTALYISEPVFVIFPSQVFQYFTWMFLHDLENIHTTLFFEVEF